MKRCPNCNHTWTEAEWRCTACGWQPPEENGIRLFAPELSQQNSGFQPAFFQELFELEAGHFWFRARNRLIGPWINHYFPEAKTYLEIGCGTGFVLSGVGETCPQLTRHGSEIYAEGLKYAQQRLPDVTLFQMDARNVPFAQEFDVIGMYDVLEHIEEDEAVLGQLKQAVKPGGGIVLTVPQHQFMWSASDEFACHVRRYEASELRSKVEAAGFKMVRMTSFVSLLFPLMVLSRLRGSRSAENYSHNDEFALHPALNWSFEQVMTAERGLIEAGLNLPFGGSLLLVAKAV